MKKTIFATLLLLFSLPAAAANIVSLPTVAQMQAIGTLSPQYGTVVVTGTQGGTFTWVSGSLPCNSSTGGGDGGTTFCAGRSGAYVTTGYWQRQYSGTDVSIWWFEATVGVDDTAAIQAALNTNKGVSCPAATYVVTANITLKRARQQFYGVGTGTCELDFSLASPGDGFTVQSAGGAVDSEHVRISNMYFKGVSNTTNLLSVGGSRLTLSHMRLQNNVANSTIVNLPDEVSGSGLYTFGLEINENSILTGPIAAQSDTDSGCGVAFGNNSQTAHISHTTIEKVGNGVCFTGANTGTSIDGSTVFQFITDAGYAIKLSGGSTPPIYNLSITDDYCEQCQHFLLNDNADVENLKVDNLVAARSSGAATSGSCIYCTGASAFGGDKNISVTNVNVASSDYEAVFNLAHVNAARALVSTKGISLDNGSTLFSTGTYADYAYQTRIVNPAFISPIVNSGAIASNTIARMSIPAADIYIPIQLDNHEYVEKVCTYYIPTGGGATITENFISRDASTSSASPVTEATSGAITTEQYLCTTVHLQAAPHTQYYLQSVTSGGSDNIIYPPTLYLRQ